MNLTLGQVADKLGSGKQFVNRLVTRGLLTPVNERKPGAVKFFALFDSAQVNTLARSGVVRPVAGRRKRVRLDTAVAQSATAVAAAAPAQTALVIGRATPSAPVVGIVSRLDAIEIGLAEIDGKLTDIGGKLDRLLAVWS
jgi:hypothetical protein